MIHREDPSPMTERRYNTVVPFDCMVYEDGRREIYVYRPYYRVARQYQAKFADRPFDREALDFLHEALKDPVAAYGYRADEETRCDVMRILSLTEADAVRRERIRPDTVFFDSEEAFLRAGLVNRTDLPIGQDLTCATVIGGEVLSAATLNPHEEGDLLPEMTVETAVGQEGHGYAASNAAALAVKLTEDGRGASWVCAESNPASLRVAQAVGFTADARAYYYVCYDD